MELFTSVWFIGIAAFAIGAGAGILFFQLFASDNTKSRKLEDQLAQVEQDFELFQERVNSHFNKTSELMQELTEDYVKVYRHLAEGAQKLGDSPKLSQQNPATLINPPNHDNDGSEISPPKDYAAGERDDDEDSAGDNDRDNDRNKKNLDPEDAYNP